MDDVKEKVFEIITAKQSKELSQVLENNDIQIKPDGPVYLPAVLYRKRLNDVLGSGNWTLKQVESKVPDENSRVYWAGELHVNGKFVSSSIGEQAKFDKMSLATAKEGARSDCLTRCCKDLGVAWQLWEPNFQNEYKDKHCELIECYKTQKGSDIRVSIWKRKSDKLRPPYKAILADLPEGVTVAMNSIVKSGLSLSGVLALVDYYKRDWVKLEKSLTGLEGVKGGKNVVS